MKAAAASIANMATQQRDGIIAAANDHQKAALAAKVSMEKLANQAASSCETDAGNVRELVRCSDWSLLNLNFV